ncbi:AMP-binding protein, partial [Acinetobacter baumannii]|uniref:AMP-binding protein n=1 Tax=Acinetobacter baumannii TaxID=470 RepID=UPI001111E824
FTLFGPDAIEYRLNDSGAKAVVSNAEGIEKLLLLRDRLVARPLLIGLEDCLDGSVLGFSSLLEAAAPDPVPVETSAEDPAIIVYTSGTT